jgi:hypothetical protein
MRKIAYRNRGCQTIRRVATLALLSGALLRVPVWAQSSQVSPAGTGPAVATPPAFYACLPVDWFQSFLPIEDTVLVYSDCADPARVTDPGVPAQPTTSPATQAPCKTLVWSVDPRTVIPAVFQQLQPPPSGVVDPVPAPVPAPFSPAQ